MTRFNNQGACISNPIPQVAVVDKSGGMTQIVTASEAQTIINAKSPFGNINVDLTSVKRTFLDLVNSGVSRVAKNVTNKIKGFFG